MCTPDHGAPTGPDPRILVLPPADTAYRIWPITRRAVLAWITAATNHRLHPGCGDNPPVE